MTRLTGQLGSRRFRCTERHGRRGDFGIRALASLDKSSSEMYKFQPSPKRCYHRYSPDEGFPGVRAVRAGSTAVVTNSGVNSGGTSDRGSQPSVDLGSRGQSSTAMYRLEPATKQSYRPGFVITVKVTEVTRLIGSTRIGARRAIPRDW